MAVGSDLCLHCLIFLVLWRGASLACGYPAWCGTPGLPCAPAVERLGLEKQLVWDNLRAKGCWGGPVAEGCGLYHVGSRMAAGSWPAYPCAYPIVPSLLQQCLLDSQQAWKVILVVPDL